MGLKNNNLNSSTYLFILDLALYSFDSIGGFYIKCDCLSSKGLYKDLHFNIARHLNITLLLFQLQKLLVKSLCCIGAFYKHNILMMSACALCEIERSTCHPSRFLAAKSHTKFVMHETFFPASSLS